MTTDEVVEKLLDEMSESVNDKDVKHQAKFKYYLNLALTIGYECGLGNSDEIIALTRSGKEIGTFKNALHASLELGVSDTDINNVLNGLAYSVGGYVFTRNGKKKEI